MVGTLDWSCYISRPTSTNSISPKRTVLNASSITPTRKMLARENAIRCYKLDRYGIVP